MNTRIIIFYKYVRLHHVEEVCNWTKAICTALGLKGRVILAQEGINGTLAGSNEAIETYIAAMNAHPSFKKIDYKNSFMTDDADYFPRLRVVVKREIVRMDVDPDAVTTADAGKHLSPLQAHNLMSKKPEDLVILDGRNDYESRIGCFEGAVTPMTRYFREFPQYIDQNAEQFKDKQVLMFCTSGVRCERASAYLKLKGVAKEVYQITGGIQRYVEQFPDGFFRGKNYVFDDRIEVKVNNDVLSNCDLCATPYDTYTNCMNAKCNKHFICCDPCRAQLSDTCSQTCKDLVTEGKVPVRPPLRIAKRNFGMPSGQ